MNIVPFVHEGLGNSSYLVGLDDGTALLVDPDRSVQRYLDQAHAMDWRIKAVLETHLHADFVSGAHEVAAGTGARLLLPRDAEVTLPHEPLDAGRRIAIDGVEIEAFGSPGHTPEHLSYAIRTAGHAPALFSGGSLIVGGAARTDLISPAMTDELTRAQFRTLTNAFNAMPDDTLLYPTHGGGSFCSAGGGGTRTSTLGHERATNPVLLAAEDEDEFVTWFPTTFPAAPAYFYRMRAFNQAGPRLRGDIASPRPLTPAEFVRVHEHATVIDVRPPHAYGAAHIDGALSIAFRDAFAVWLGWLVPPNRPLLFVHDGIPLNRVVDEALLVGYEDFAGVLEGGMSAWSASGRPSSTAEFLAAPVAREALHDGAVALDVRERAEYDAAHLPGAVHIPLGELGSRLDELQRDRPIVAYCGHGERSASAISILERSGHTQLMNLEGGIGAWREAEFPVAV